MKEKINTWLPLVIVIAAACVTVPRLAAAFAMVEPGFMGISTAWITGPGYGVLAMAAAVYSLQTYQERKALKLAHWILVGWGVILVLASLILLPGAVVMVRQSMLADVLPYPLDALWCLLLMLSPEILVGVSALAFALKREKPATSRPKPTPSKVEPIVSEAKQFPCQHCGFVGSTQAALNAHQRKHSKEERDGNSTVP